MEEVATFIFRFVGCVLSEIILGTFIYWFGWSFVKLTTLGGHSQSCWEKTREEIYIACVGVVGCYRHTGRGRPTLFITKFSIPVAPFAGLGKNEAFARLLTQSLNNWRFNEPL